MLPVSRFLRFECDPIDQPSAVDPLERLTWCAMRISVGPRAVTELWDKTLETERRNLYLPAFPIAQWLVANWWALLNEVSPAETITRGELRQKEWFWASRHCLRTADSSLMLPALYLYHDGRTLRAEWRRDAAGSTPHWPGEFIAEDAAELDFGQTVEALSNFVNETLVRVREHDDPRVVDLLADWRAIQASDDDERSFCTLAGRLGLDPYFEGLPESLVNLLEALNTDAPLVRDLTDLAQPDAFVQQWEWVNSTINSLALNAAANVSAVELPSQSIIPPEFGYELARWVRERAAHDLTGPVDSVEQLATSAIGRQLRFLERNHFPGEGIKAVIGHSPQGDIVVAGPPPPRLDSRRFLMARSLYHAITNSYATQRLVTNAHSWDQKASRAFAAELLAPREALLRQITTDDVDDDTINALGDYFEVSSLLVRRQLSNAGLPIEN